LLQAEKIDQKIGWLSSGFLVTVSLMVQDTHPDVAARRAADLAVRKAFAVLRTCSFQTALSPAETEMAEAVSHTKPRNVYYVAGRWFVKSYLAGEQRTWGVYALDEYAQAFRLADVLALRFWKYRRAAFNPISETAFNLTKERATADNENEGEIISALLQIEAALIHSGELNADPKDKTRPEYKTVGGEMEKNFDLVLNRLTDMERRLSEAQAELHLAFKRLEERVDRVRPIISYSPGIPTVVPKLAPTPPAPAASPIFTCQNTGCPTVDESASFKS
jgi:hypothetical protein